MALDQEAIALGLRQGQLEGWGGGGAGVHPQLLLRGLRLGIIGRAQRPVDGAYTPSVGTGARL